MTREELQETLRLHEMWLNNEEGGKKADLKGADLRGADLYGANLQGADLQKANLRGADLQGANLQEVNLKWADLQEVNLKWANLQGANLYGANLQGANLRGAENIPYFPLACPSEDAFTGWKKVDNHLVKLLIPEDAKRSSATTNKCRCSYAIVQGIWELEYGECIREVNEITNTQYNPTTYRVGQEVHPDSYDEDRWNECSHGIHFFINKQDAIDY